jgi:hypothetical protein
MDFIKETQPQITLYHAIHKIHCNTVAWVCLVLRLASTLYAAGALQNSRLQQRRYTLVSRSISIMPFACHACIRPQHHDPSRTDKSSGTT